MYFYMAIPFVGLSNPVEIFSKLEHCARDEILATGGSVSHHHGIGKHRKHYMRDTIGDVRSLPLLSFYNILLSLHYI